MTTPHPQSNKRSGQKKKEYEFLGILYIFQISI